MITLYAVDGRVFQYQDHEGVMVLSSADYIFYNNRADGVCRNDVVLGRLTPPLDVYTVQRVDRTTSSKRLQSSSLIRPEE